MRNASFATGAPNTIDWDTDTIRILLTKGVADTTAESTAAADFIDLADFGTTTSLGELTDASYTGQGDLTGTGRYNLTASGLADYANNQTEFDAADVTWTALTADSSQSVANAVGGGVVHKAGASAFSGPLICWVDLGNVIVNGVDFTVQWASEGVFKMVAISAPA